LSANRVMSRRYGHALILLVAVLVGVVSLAVIVGVAVNHFRGGSRAPLTSTDRIHPPLVWEARMPVNTSGLSVFLQSVKPWGPDASLEEIGSAWTNVGSRTIEQIDQQIERPGVLDQEKLLLLIRKTLLLLFEGEPVAAYKVLGQARVLAESRDNLGQKSLFSIIYLQGITGLRRGETENCIMCRGEGSCILPIAPSARHQIPDGSRLAIKHFSEYLRQFPDDLEVRWLLNLAHMTLGEYPDKVEPRFLVSFDKYLSSEFDIGKFRDIGHLAGVNLLNQAGGAVMEDFDNDGLLDLAVTSFDPTMPMSFYRNKGDGTFDDVSKAAGVTDQLGGSYCVQTDYNNDGFMDIFIARGGAIDWPMRPSLLRNNGNCTFTDVTIEAGLIDPVNSIAASWADFDNDGWLDLFICCEKQPNHLYHNKGDGTFEEIAGKAGVHGDGQPTCKGSAWVDFDNDGDPDLFLNYLIGSARLFRNDGKGTFTEVTQSLGIEGPKSGFSCWAWDYDNDGWLDIFATCYDSTLGDIIKGLQGQPHRRQSNKLFHNRQGKGFVDVTKGAGLDMVFSTMGSNFGDFDNDGFLDMYLATGDPDLTTLVPNRMFKNVAGERFAEITASSGTGHLQKGHAVACGDWDRDGDLDLFVHMGGAVNGDKYHNVLFANPGQGNHALTVKLVGQKTNRAAIGARIKVVTAGETPMTVHRHVSSGSSFGANTLQQSIGLGKATQVASLEIYWPTSGTTQVFRDIAGDQAIEVTEFAADYRTLNWSPIPQPK
jgi:hypothetical protein